MSNLMRRDERPDALQAYEPLPPGHYGGDLEETSATLQKLRDFFLQVLLKHKWLILATTALIVFLAALQAFTVTPVYRASVRIQVDPQYPSVLPYSDVTGDASFVRTREYLQTQVEILNSRMLALRVIERFDLPQNPVFNFRRKPGALIEAQSYVVGRISRTVASLVAPLRPSPQPEVSEASVESIGTAEEETNPNERFIPRLRGDLDVAVIPSSRILEVGYQSHNPVFAARVVDLVAREYIDLNREGKQDSAASASGFLQRELKELHVKMEEAEEALNEYARRNSILDLDQPENLVLDKVTDFSRQITRVEGELSTAKAKYEVANEATVEDFPDSLADDKVHELQRRISTLKQRRATLLARFGPRWPEVLVLNEEIAELDAQLQSEKRQTIAAAKADHETSLKGYEHLLATLELQKRVAEQQNEKLIQYRTLRREVDTYRQLYDGMLRRMKETGISAEFQASNIQIIDRSGPPTQPSSRRAGSVLVLSLLGGLMCGLGLATARELLDNTVKTPEEIERLFGLPSLGVIPTIRGIKAVSRESAAPQVGEPREAAIIPYREPYSSSWEPYRGLRTAILLSHSETRPKTILVTSGLPEEGKTTTAVNLGIVLAQTSARTLLLDLDMRRPRLSSIFGFNGQMGMSVYLSGNIATADIRETAIPNLLVLSAGKEPPNPAELIGSKRMREVLKQLSEEFDYVVIDSPPVLTYTDAVILSPLVNGVVMVAKSGKTTRKAIQSSSHRLWSVGAKILGAVLNDVDLNRPGYSYFYPDYYRHYYHHDR